MPPEYELPDPTTPCRGPDEEQALMRSPRYKSDGTYRAAVAQKLALGLSSAPKAETRIKGTRIQFSDDGQMAAGPLLKGAIDFTARDLQDANTERELRAEIAANQAIIDQMEADENSKLPVPGEEGRPLPPPRPFTSSAEMQRLISSEAYRSTTPYGARFRAFVAERLRLTQGVPGTAQVDEALHKPGYHRVG